LRINIFPAYHQAPHPHINTRFAMILYELTLLTPCLSPIAPPSLPYVSIDSSVKRSDNVTTKFRRNQSIEVGVIVDGPVIRCLLSLQHLPLNLVACCHCHHHHPLLLHHLPPHCLISCNNIAAAVITATSSSPRPLLSCHPLIIVRSHHIVHPPPTLLPRPTPATTALVMLFDRQHDDITPTVNHII